MKPESWIAFLIFCLVLILVMVLQGCAPYGYIDGQTACQIEVERLREENQDVRDKYVRYNPEPEMDYEDYFDVSEE